MCWRFCFMYLIWMKSTELFYWGSETKLNIYRIIFEISKYETADSTEKIKKSKLSNNKIYLKNGFCWVLVRC